MATNKVIRIAPDIDKNTVDINDLRTGDPIFFNRGNNLKFNITPFRNGVIENISSGTIYLEIKTTANAAEVPLLSKSTSSFSTPTLSNWKTGSDTCSITSTKAETVGIGGGVKRLIIWWSNAGSDVTIFSGNIDVKEDGADNPQAPVWQVDHFERQSNKGQADGYVPLNSSTKINDTYLPSSLTTGGTYLGAISGSSVPATATNAGDWYYITGSGISQGTTWAVGDKAIYTGTSGNWTKITVGSGDIQISANTKSALESLNAASLTNGQVANMKGILNQYEGVGGDFQLDNTGSLGASAQNGGTRLTATGVTNGYWRKIKSYKTVDLSWFGVTGDGVTDDTSKISDCFDAVAQSGEEVEVYVPRPSVAYKIVWPGSKHADTENAAIKVPKKCSIRGDGMYISRFLITGQEQSASPTNPYQAFQFDGDNTCSGIWFDGDIAENSYVYNASYNGNELVHLHNNTGGVNVQSNNVEFSSCQFSHAGGMSVSGHNLKNIRINECTFRYTSNGCNVNADNFFVTNNFVEHAEGFETSHAISGGGWIVFENNLLRKIYGGGISLGGFNTDSSPGYQYVCRNNTIDFRERTSPTAEHAITINDNVTTVDCSNNFLYGSPSQSECVGIVVNQTSLRQAAYANISGNIIFDFKTGIQINHSGSNPQTDFFLKNNNIKSTVAGIDLTSNEATFYIYGNCGKTGFEPIKLSTSSSPKYYIGHNTITRNDILPVRVNPSGTPSSPYDILIYDLNHSGMEGDVLEWVRTWDNSANTGQGWFKRTMAGEISWGAGGSNTFDTNLYRTAANHLKSDDKFEAVLGFLTSGQVDCASLKISNTSTPSSATDTGTTGEIRWDANYIYVCTATNTWKRVAIATW